MSEDRVSSGPSTDMSAFRELFAKARNIVALSGAGISAESGVPTFRFVQIMLHRIRIAIYYVCLRRGAGGYWRTYQATQLATPESFAANPSLVWEFYHYRRELMGSKHPNAAHKVGTFSLSTHRFLACKNCQQKIV